MPCVRFLTPTAFLTRKRGIDVKRGCTQCGECLNVCPVFLQHFREEYSPKGKRILMEPVDNGTPTNLTWKDVFAFARMCAGCGRCKKACARKLSTADLLADVRSKHPHWTQHMWELWIKHMGPLWPSIGFLSTLVPNSIVPKMLESSIVTAKALVSEKNIPQWIRIRRAPAVEIDPSPVVLFAGCTANNVRPQWIKKAKGFLTAWGYPLLDASAFTCCGGTMHHAGQYKAMNAMRQKNVETWRALGKPRIAVFCASCHHSLEEYADSPLEGAEAKEWKKALTPLTSLLVGARGLGTGAKAEKYGYHQPCHWEKDKDMPFLSSVMPGLTKGTGLCCGMGGILKMTDPDLSNDMAKACLAKFPQNITEVLTGCSGCTMQLAASAPEGVSVYHWLDVVEG